MTQLNKMLATLDSLLDSISQKESLCNRGILSVDKTDIRHRDPNKFGGDKNDQYLYWDYEKQKIRRLPTPDKYDVSVKKYARQKGYALFDSDPIMVIRKFDGEVFAFVGYR